MTQIAKMILLLLLLMQVQLANITILYFYEYYITVVFLEIFAVMTYR